MESSWTPQPDEAATALGDARRSQEGLAARLRLPGLFFGSIAVAVATQLATTAVGLAVGTTWSHLVLAAGLLVFCAVAVAQLTRFRNLNGVWIAGLAHRAVLGTATTASLSYTAALAGAVWAGHLDLWWLTAVCSAAGGIGYALGGRRWFSAYRGDPVAHSRAQSRWQLLAFATLAAAGVVLLLAAA
ncbi:hypothetical protein UO65_6039 [Actinokineospora spheciospongiae]|uniref:Uncharacterized protein n=1 Tax=Actinokineospora spheciospongiae TaxID=909613 RepID=W7ID03_9PSEU|nr:hypothetical protein [Actinokineospora spheciospongiae]EWC58685.1 hypothetical protein UO65_6039 [Actinokineospora spheciospongiae]